MCNILAHLRKDMKAVIQQVDQYSLHLEMNREGDYTVFHLYSYDSASRNPNDPRTKIKAFLTDTDLVRLKSALLEYSINNK